MSDQNEREPLYPDGIYHFADHGGEEVIDGKGYWPALLHCVMYKGQMWDTVMKLLRCLERGETICCISLSGEMRHESVEKEEE